VKARAWSGRAAADQARHHAPRGALRREVAGIAVRAAYQLLGREVDARTNGDLLDKFTAQI